MENNIYLSVIIPLYNEENNIEKLLDVLFKALINFGKGFEVILVNDGSVDNTYGKITDGASRDNRIKVINLCRNYGQTAALVAGIDFASGEIIVPMDGDLQNDPEDIPLLVRQLELGYDVVSGWRKDRKDNFLRRRLPSRIANSIISRVSGVHLHDYGCTLKAYRKEILKEIQLYGEMHRFIPIYANWIGGRVTELPVKHHPRVLGKSKYGLMRTFKVILDLLVIKFLNQYFTKPIYVFGGFGLVCLAFSILILLSVIYMRLFHGISMILTPLPLLSAMTLLIGIMSFLIGIVAEMIVRTYFESQGKRVYSVKETHNFNQDSST